MSPTLRAYDFLPLLPSSGLKSRTVIVSVNVPAGVVTLRPTAMIVAVSSATPGADSCWKVTPSCGSAGMKIPGALPDASARHAPSWLTPPSGRKRSAGSTRLPDRPVDLQRDPPGRELAGECEQFRQ